MDEQTSQHDTIPHMKPSLWSRITLFWNILWSKQTPTSLKVLMIAAVIYGLVPIDFIPDAIPLLGIVDDSALLIAAIWHIWQKTHTERTKKRH